MAMEAGAPCAAGGRSATGRGAKAERTGRGGSGAVCGGSGWCGVCGAEAGVVAGAREEDFCGQGREVPGSGMEVEAMPERGSKLRRV